MDTNADNLDLNQDELIIQQQRQIEKEVSKQIIYFMTTLVSNKSTQNLRVLFCRRVYSDKNVSLVISLSQPNFS